MAKRKNVPVNPSVIIFAGVLLVLSLLLLKTAGEKELAQGNYELATFKYQAALSSYKKAGMLWPFIKNNSGYQKNITKTQSTLEAIKKSPAANIFMKSDATDEEIQNLAQEIRHIHGVKEVKVITQDEALKIYQGQSKNDPLVNKYVTKDMLPASLEVYTYDLPSKALQDQIASVAKSKPSVEQVATPAKNY